MSVVPSSSSSPQNLEPKPDQSTETHALQSKLYSPPKDNPNPSSMPPPVATTTEHSNPNPNPTVITPPAPPVVPSFTPSFRPVVGGPQFSPVPNPSMQNPNLHPPGVAPQQTPVMMSPYPPPGVYYSAPGQLPGIPPRPYWQGPNGYIGAPTPASQGQGLMPPPGIPRYPAPYPMMVRPGFPPRAPVPIGGIPSLGRPLVPGVSGPLNIPSVVRPIVPIIAPAEKPQTTVYVGKIASTVENDFLLSLLRLCGPVKSWKRAQDPSDGTPRGFGFCEFESAEGVLRALRLLTKLNIDGQELVLNVNQATRTYLERYVEKKTERENLKETEGDVSNGESTSSVVQKQGSLKEDENIKKDVDDSEVKEKHENPQEFGIVTDEDRDTDRDALEKIKNMLEGRLKTRPLPPPPADGPSKSSSELPSKPQEDINLDTTSAEDKNDDDGTSESKASSGRDKPESLSDKSRSRERSRERDRDRDIKRDKEKELERYEWERERERVRRERERDLKIREAERWYKDRVKEWEAREREKEYQRQYEREREKERESKHRRDILEQEDESDDEDTRKRKHRSSSFAEKKRRMQREKEEDYADRLREEEEIAEAKKRAVEEQKKKDHLKPSAADAVTISKNIEGTVEDKMDIDGQNVRPDESTGFDAHAADAPRKSNIVESDVEPIISISEIKQSNNAVSKKLGFGLATSGKRTSVLSVFHEADDEDADKDKKMRPLVPIDYSTEELQAVNTEISGTPPNLVAAAEFAKRLSGNNKEDKAEPERDRDRHRRNTERHRERERTDSDSKYTKNESRDRTHEKNHERDREREEKPRAIENKKLLDAKQLIDMIPKTKNELFSYEINWSVYDKHELHERMRPWISKKITEFLGEEEATFVDYIVSSTKDHVQATEMLQLLQPILDEEAEMFVLKMWRMLIFEIKKVEMGISTKSRS